MNYVTETIQEFGQAMGFETLSLDENGMLCLDFQISGTLYMEHLADQESVLVYLTREIPVYDTQVAAKALERCQYRQEIPFSVHCGFMEDSRIVFMVRFEPGEFTFPHLSQAVDLLKKWQKQVAG